MVIGTALGWSTWPAVILAVVLAFVFGYASRCAASYAPGSILAPP